MKLLFLSVVAALLLSGPASRTASAGTAAVTPAGPPPVATRQLADEITRRLRRMGFTVIQSRTARPSEMLGEFC